MGGGIGVVSADAPDDISISDLDGDGTADDPYLITNISELQAINQDLSASYKLANDIDASDTEDWNDGDGFDPIGTETDRFIGSFAGQGYTVSDLTINRSQEEYVGLFGATGSDADIEDVHIVDATVYGDENIGILAGHNNGSVIGSSGSGYVQAGLEDNIAGWSVRVGGLVGENEGTITESYATGDLYVPTSGTTSHYYVGGLIGDNAGEVTETFADVNVESNRGDGVGGLIGSTTGDVHNSYAVGDVIGRADVGALIGDNNAEHVTVTTSYAAGHAEAHFTAAGLVGHNDGNSFGDGAVVSDSYWNRETTNQVDGLGNNWGSFTAEGMTTPQMVGDDAETEMSDLNFDTTWETVNASHEHADDNGYPILRAIDAEPQIETPVVEHLLDGTGTEDDPYQVSDVDDLQTVDEYQHRHYELTDDIDATGTQDWNGGDGFDPIAEQGDGFSATFDGNGHTISGLTINSASDDEVGLFEALHREAIVKNVTLEAVDVTAENGEVGALAGVSHGTVNDVTVSGKVVAEGSVAGGVVGTNEGPITDTSAAVEIEGTWNVGGLIGSNLGDVTRSNASGDVQGSYQRIGGLIGSDGAGDIVASNATGDVDAAATAGGLIGQAGIGTEIIRSHATGDVETTGSRVGGLVGSASGYSGQFIYIATESYASGNVTGQNDVGGLIGEIEQIHVRDSYAIGSVTGVDRVGGLIGDVDEATIRRSYATGSVQGDAYVGGVIGVNDAFDRELDYVYWDRNATLRDVGVGDDGDGYWDEMHGLTTDQMSGESAASSMDELEFGDEWVTVTSSHEHAEEDRYPVLRFLNQESQIDAQAAAESDPADAHFEATITDFDQEVYVGQTVSLTVDIENTGTGGAEQNITFLAGNEEINETSSILNSDGNKTFAFDYTTRDSDLGEVDLTVETPNASDVATVDVIEFMSDTETGDEVWNFSVVDQIESSPTVVNDTIYVGSGGFKANHDHMDTNVYAINRTTGEKEWNFSTDHRFESSPIVVDGTLYIGSSNGNIYALNADTGEKEWSFSTADEIISSPTVVDDVLYVGNEEGNLTALNADTGDLAWQFEADEGEDARVEASPVVAGEKVYITNSAGTVFAIDRAAGDEVWNRSVGSSWISSVTIANGSVFVANEHGHLSALDPITGQVHWTFQPDEDVEADLSARHIPTVYDGTIYHHHRGTGEFHAINASDGTVDWSSDVDLVSSTRLTSPTVADGVVFMGGQDVTALDANDGSELWEFHVDNPIESSPTVVDGVLYVGAGTGISEDEESLYAIDAGVNGSSEDSRVLHRTLGHHAQVDAIASVLTEPREPVPGEQFTLTAEQSITFNDEIEEYRWDLSGDGQIDETMTNPTIEHEFEEPGTYEIGLEIEDNTGETASTTTEVVVSERGTLSGEVTDQDGDPIPDATVELVDDNVNVGTAAADANGEFELTVPAGTYTLEVNAEEYLPYIEADVSIPGDETKTLDLALYDPGSGTEDDPYRIADADGVQDMQSDLDAHYVLVSDIDASGTAQWKDGAGFEPIGYTGSGWSDPDHPFTGSFDGQGYEITGLTIDRPTEDEVGLFGYAEGATIENVTLSNVDVTGDSWAVGGMIGYTDEETTIADVGLSGTVSASDQYAWGVGGLAGVVYGDSSIEYVESTVDVMNGAPGGGLVGDFGNSVIRNSTASGHVTGEYYVGGLVGYDWQGDDGGNLITNSSATGDVDASDWGAGGLIGYNEVDVRSSYATGDVSGQYGATGGLIGFSWTGEVAESYATGNVSGDDEVGGLIGDNDGPVSNSYATGDVSGTSTIGALTGTNDGDVIAAYATGQVADVPQSGGVIGVHDNGNLTASYFDAESTNQTEAVGVNHSLIGSTVSGLPTGEMTGAAAEDHMAAFDFDETWETVPDTYPRLSDEPTVPSDTVTVDVTADPDVITVGDEMTFDASNSSAQEGEIVAYHWDFTEDGEIDETTETPETVHEYEQDGQYDVEVVIETDAGILNTTSVQVEVEPRTGTVTGQVVDAETGEPIPDATVSISELASNTTDEDGTYSLDVRIGEYRMVVNAQDYEWADIDDVVIEEDEETVQDIELLSTLDEGVSGTVVDEDDAPIGDAKTVLYDIENQSIKAVTNTTASGDYQFDVGSGIYRVLTTKDGYTAASSQEFVLNDGEVETLDPQVIIKTEWDHTLSGAVTGANPDPVEGALVMLQHDGTHDFDFAITAGDGSYEVGAMDGVNQITVYDESLQTKSYELSVDDSMTEDIVLEETDATVTGQVTHEDEPVPGAGILAIGENDVIVAETMSNDSGYYQFDMPAGNIDLVVFSDHGTKIVSESIDTGEISEINLSLPAADAVVHGSVIDRESEQPLPNIQVEVVHPAIGITVDHAVTDHNGQFTISEAPGEYDLELTGDIMVSHTETIEIESGETELDPIEVTLHDDVEQLIDGIVLDDEDAPVAGADVVLLDWETYSVADIAETDGEGTFEFSPEPGSYVVMTAPNGSWTASEWVDLMIGETETVTLDVQPTDREHTVTVTVEDRLSGEPIGESLLMVHSEGPATIGVTNETGSDDLAVDAGQYHLEVLAEGYLDHEMSFEVTENDSKTVELFPHDATIGVNVTGEAGDPIPGVDLEPYLLTDEGPEPLGGWSTDGDGLADLELPTGEFEVVLFHDEYGYHFESITVDDDDETVHDITLSRDTATVTGQVVDNETNESFEQADVVLKHPDLAIYLDHIEITDGGSFEFQTGAGEFGLEAFVPDVGSASIELTVERNESKSTDIEVATPDEPALDAYTTDDGVVDTDGLRDAVSDWRSGEIDTELLRDVVSYWRSGEPI